MNICNFIGSFVYVVCLLCNKQLVKLSNFTIKNIILADLSSNFKGLSSKCKCMNRVSCYLHATHPHMIYVIHLISICDHCLG